MIKKLLKMGLIGVVGLSGTIAHAGDIPTAAKILAEALNGYQHVAKEALKAWQKSVTVDSGDITKAAQALAQAVKIDTKDFKNPTFHMGESTQKATLAAAEKLLQSSSVLAQALKEASLNISKTGNSLGLNPESAALLQELLKHIPSEKLSQLKLSQFLDKALTLEHKAAINIEKQTVDDLSAVLKQLGYIASGLAAEALSLYIAALLAHKHIMQNDAQYTKADGLAGCATGALALGGLALIYYSAWLAQAA